MSPWKCKKNNKRMAFHFPGTSQIRWAPLTSWWSNLPTSDYTTLTCPSLPPWSGTCVGVAKHKIQCTNTKNTRRHTTFSCPSPPCTGVAHKMHTPQHFRILVLVLWNTKHNVQTQSTMHKHKVLESATIYEWLAANRRLRDVCILATWPNSPQYNTILWHKHWPGHSFDQHQK